MNRADMPFLAGLAANEAKNMKKTSELIWQDEQHQELFRIIDSLTTEDGRRALDRLRTYVDHHFSLEEAYMAQLNYPGTEAHIQAHRNFEKTVKDFLADQTFYDENFAKTLSAFATDWLTSHIMGIDKDFEAFVLKSERK